MAKRAATSELNHDNWDAEEESESPGTFKPLGESELKNRIIKKAKRSLGSKEGVTGSSPFAAFSGFASNRNTSSPFSFLNKNAFGDGNKSSSVASESNEKKENGSSVANEEKKNTESITESTNKSRDACNKQKPSRNIEYYRHLQSLNESLMNWMQLHLSKNACCDFTPVFNDYKKHLDMLNLTYPIKGKGSETTEKQTTEKQGFFSSHASDDSSEQMSNDASCVKKSSNKSEDETDYGAHFSSNTTNTSTFSFGMKRTPTATSSRFTGPTTSLKEEAVPEKKPFQFSFGLKSAQGQDDSSTNKPFSFVSNPADKSTESEAATEDQEYAPPKNEFVAVKEEDAFYSKRCKLFFKKDDSYVERGIGTLHLKPCEGKTQLLIRADTSLGNILLNIMLSSSLPMSRTGKNNVLIVCVPNPPVGIKSESKEAIPMLIRVKTSEDADELLKTLEKHKS